MPFSLYSQRLSQRREILVPYLRLLLCLSSALKCCLLLALLLLLQACTSNPRHADARACAQQLADFEDNVRRAGIWLSDPRPVPAFPGFASNRFLASFDTQAMESAQRKDWLMRLLEAGKQRRALLASMLNQRLVERGNLTRPGLRALEDCAMREMHALADDPVSIENLLDALQVPDDYSLWRRTLGLYPLASLAARAGIRDLQTELRETYAVPAQDLPVEGSLRYYAPPLGDDLDARQSVPPLQKLERDALGTRVPDDDQLQALFEHHAPIWAVDTVGEFDRPGAPFLDVGDMPRVDSSKAVVFTYPSMTRFQGEALLQLNYLLWFDARPKEGRFDTLGGRLDGLVWRVTLNHSGQVLLYDSVHACGCYQLFFPGSTLAIRDTAASLPEPPLLMRTAPTPSADQRVILHVSTAAHYLRGLSVSQPGTPPIASQQRYAFADYTELYGVKAPGGRASLFDRHGIVRGTERGERLYLWPMGIRSPGAMRERGRQATAFLGRRHFDDADLVDQIFRSISLSAE